MKLVVYPLTQMELPIRAAPAKRDWMDATPDAFAYRCLPLNIANSHGWEILNMRSFEAVWSGEVAPGAIDIRFDPTEPVPSGAHVKPMAHFGSGVLTFELPMMFRTPPGWNIWTMPPVNRFKDGIQALSGIIEADWSPYTFTMNWMFTRPGRTIRFATGEPIAHILPIKRGHVERFEPEIRSMYDDPDCLEQNRLWRESRSGFIDALEKREADAVKEKWQKAYYRGQRPDGRDGVKDHQIKLRVREFTRPVPGPRGKAKRARRS